MNSRQRTAGRLSALQLRIEQNSYGSTARPRFTGKTLLWKYYDNRIFDLDVPYLNQCLITDGCEWI